MARDMQCFGQLLCKTLYLVDFTWRKKCETRLSKRKTSFIGKYQCETNEIFSHHKAQQQT